MGNKTTEQLFGSLELLILRVLASGDTLHGYAITDKIHSCSVDVLRVEEGSLYPALHRMDEAGWITSEWGISENNRRARYYQITKTGRRRLSDLEKNWAKHVEGVKRVLKLA